MMMFKEGFKMQKTLDKPVIVKKIYFLIIRDYHCSTPKEEAEKYGRLFRKLKSVSFETYILFFPFSLK